MRILALLILLISFRLHAQEGGMWIPSLLEGMNEIEMASLGSKLSAKDIYDLNGSSLKDAIGHFGGGCTSSIISPKGLVLTNHHCGFPEIQLHSSLENDYLKNGFWAKNLSEELPNEGLDIEFIVRIEDVTKMTMDSVVIGMSVDEKQARIDKNIKNIQAQAKKEEWQETKVRAFYQGNQYFMFITERFEDIRLVGAPPTSIGKFGSDTDNWVFPRHTGDFSLFRIYADANNRPAKYSKDNIPYTPKHYLPISLDGIDEGDFTLVFGFPGRTNEYLPAVAMEHITKYYNPSNITIREAALKVIDAEMKKSDAVRIKYASKQARIANAWKKWIGENLGVSKSRAIENRKKLEAEFNQALKEKSLVKQYGHILPALESSYNDFATVDIKRSNFVQVFLVTNELMQMTFRAYQFEQKVTNDPNNLSKAKEMLTEELSDVLKNYDVNVDRGVFTSVMPYYTEMVDVSIYDKTAFTSMESVTNLLTGDTKQILKKLNADPAYAYAKPMIDRYFNKINKEFNVKSGAINDLQAQFMKALMEVLPNERYFPDANGTIRVSYGQVRGYSPRDAVHYHHVSYLEGVMEKYVADDYEFDVPEKLKDLYARKDYGQYADSNGKVPVCFIGTNHTTGGNSGSPAIDANGNLIGLNFDRVWEGTMSDMNFDSELCRNIMVDMRYVLFIIDKYAGATHLIEEMKLVHPKK